MLRIKLAIIIVVGTIALTGTAVRDQPLPRAEAATFTVNNLDDDGAGSLRQAILAANTALGADVIDFSVTGTINLTSSLGVFDTVIINGSGITLDGGSVTLIMVVGSGASVTLNDLTFQNGSALDGGAIYNSNSTLTITNSTFSANTADFGGAIYNFGTLNIDNSTFSDNSAVGGGAIYNSLGRTLDIDSSTFSDNSASDSGGAIHNSGGMLPITNSTFSGNSASNGGAIHNDNGGTLNIDNSTFSDNSAVGGGAIYNFVGVLAITSSTFSGNTAAGAGDTLDSPLGTINIASSLIAGGDCSGTINDAGNNLSFNATGCPGTVADPQLGSLQNNGGPTDTILPALSGPAVNAYAAPCATATDQRGITRPQGLFCDIGATEQELTTDISISKTDSPEPVTVGNNLTYTITLTNNNPGIPAQNVEWTDTLPSGTFFFFLGKPAGWSCITPPLGQGGTVTCSNTLMTTSTAGFLIAVIVPTNYSGSNPIENTVSVSADNDSNTANNSASTTTTVIFPVTDTPIPPTDTPVPPTDTPVPPTNTPVPPTDTPIPPTDTPVPPTDTPIPPTDTPVPPTDTPVPPTDTPIPPTDTPTGPAALVASAACNLENLEVTISAGDGPFNITASAGVNTPVNGVNTGTTTINGPEKWDNLTVTETTGDLQAINLGQFKCRSDEVPVPLTPAHGSHTTNPFPLFSWTAISNANNYRIFVFDDKVVASRTVDIRQNSGGPTSMTLSVPLPNKRLFWRVRGRQNRLWSLWSVRFTLFKDPAPPLVAPTPVPTLDLNPPQVPTVGPVVIPTFPPPPNSR
ncbi:MAG: hypothetical protein L0154_09765 [Chloroflexi bacterium]|nr:hypothetical protein [Chloroflexota bacterium]